MYIVQKRNSKDSLWHTCKFNGKKCRYADLVKAQRIIKALAENSDALKHPEWEFRIWDTISEKDA